VASYRVLVYSTDEAGTRGCSALLQEFDNPINLGFASYLNDIGEAFFTISQRHAKVDLRDHIGSAHVVIIRKADGNTDVVWRGIIADIDATQEDVVYYAYGYEHLLFSLHTGWNKLWSSVAIAGASGRPVNDLWARAIAFLDSPLAFASTGTLQAPWTTNAQDVVLTLNKYRVNHKRILQSFRELTAIAVSDTDNKVYMELDYPVAVPSTAAGYTLTFNYWRDRSTDTTVRLEFPGNVMSFTDRYTPSLIRNKILGVGSGPRNQLYRFNVGAGSGFYGRNGHLGMRQEPMYLTWVRDRKELKRVARRRLKVAQRGLVDVYVRLFPDTLAPWRATVSTHNLGDRVYADLQFGITDINSYCDLMGEQVVWVGGREYVQPMIEAATSYSEG
jgi:hypothetical protein